MGYAQKIRDLRIDYDFTQKEIAELLRTTKNQIGKYEREEQDMNIKHLITLCNLYEVSADYILELPKGRAYGNSINEERRATPENVRRNYSRISMSHKCRTISNKSNN